MLNVLAHWRLKPSFSELSPFGAQDGRPLRIVIDSQTAPADAGLELLREFSRRPCVEIFATEDRSLPTIELGPEDRDRDALRVIYNAARGRREAALFAASSWRAHAHAAAVEYGLNEHETWRGLMLTQASRRHEIDALVCGAAVLRTQQWAEHAREGHLVSSDAASALLGLCLRAHNDFTVSVTGNVSNFMPFERFYRGCASAALPEFPAWLGAAWAIRQERDQPRPFVLLRALEARIGRALVARDYVEIRIRHWHPDDVWDEALYFFESFLLSLGGALDALARALDSALRMNSSAGSIGFLKARWRNQLLARAPSLERFLADDTHFIAVIEAIAVLRNYIHEEVLSSEVLSDAGPPELTDYGRGVLAIKGADATRLCRATAIAGGGATWGIKRHVDGTVTTMPVLFQRAAIQHVLHAVRGLMSTQLIPDIAPAPERPFSPRYWLPSLAEAQRLLLLSGLSDGTASRAREETARR